MKKSFNQISKFGKIALTVIIVCAVICICSAIICALIPNLVIKIIFGVLIGISAIILIVFACLIQIFN